MKTLKNYILEHNERGIIVFDIDDTLLKCDDSTIKIYKQKPGEKRISLTTAEYAKDKDAENASNISWYDFSEFDDPQNIYKSIINGTPLIKNLKIMDKYINRGYEFCFLTARACEDVIKDALYKFLRTRTIDGKLKKLGNKFNKTVSHAINDITKNYKGNTAADKKANILVDLCSKYDKVIFVDDDEKNLSTAKNLKLPNLMIIKAQK